MSRAPNLPQSSLLTHNLIVGGVRTSVRLDPVMWEAFRDIAARENVTVHQLATRIKGQTRASSLTSAIRVFVVEYYRHRPDHEPQAAVETATTARSLRQ
jgi:predicted DNA-binding ribbon-helix-helix protein